MGGQVSYAKYWISLTDYFGMDSKIDSWLDFVTDSKAKADYWTLNLQNKLKEDWWRSCYEAWPSRTIHC